MKKILILAVSLAVLFSAGWQLQAQETYLFATRDTCELFLDIFRPAEGAATTFQGKEKPTVLHVFGGGFITGQRSDRFAREWARILNEDGYTVVTMDYRLGMKGYKMGKGLKGAYQSCSQFLLSQQMGVEDVFSCIAFLIKNGEALGIDPGNLVLAGSSAGAIITLAAVYDLAEGRHGELPADFRLKGAMSFAGAIVSTSGAPKFKAAPCPVALFHGTADKAVAYRHFGALARGIWGSDYLAEQFAKQGWIHCIYRFKDRTHDVAAYHHVLWPLEKQFLEENVILGHARTVDAMVDDTSLPTWLQEVSLDSIYRR